MSSCKYIDGITLKDVGHIHTKQVKHICINYSNTDGFYIFGFCFGFLVSGFWFLVQCVYFGSSFGSIQGAGCLHDTVIKRLIQRLTFEIEIQGGVFVG